MSDSNDLLQALIDEIKGLREDVKRLQSTQSVVHYHYQNPGVTWGYQPPYYQVMCSDGNTGGVFQC